jgi:hypothetical protein
MNEQTIALARIAGGLLVVTMIQGRMIRRLRRQCNQRGEVIKYLANLIDERNGQWDAFDEIAIHEIINSWE